MARSTSGESVLTRAVRILNLFTSASPTLSVSDIAHRARLPVPTAHRLVVEMVSLGVLERDEDKRVRIGLHMWELASRSSDPVNLRQAAMPFMEDLQSVVRQHTQLGVLDGAEVLYIDRLSARSAVVNLSRIAGRMPIYACSAGLVLLAHSPAEFQEQVLSAPLKRFTERTITDPARLRQMLAEVRLNGYAIARGFISPEGTGVAAPIRDGSGQVIATLGIVIPLNDPHPQAQVPALMAAARGITRVMSGRLTRGEEN